MKRAHIWNDTAGYACVEAGGKYYFGEPGEPLAYSLNYAVSISNERGGGTQYDVPLGSLVGLAAEYRRLCYNVVIGRNVPQV